MTAWDDLRVVARWMVRAWSGHLGWLALIVSVSGVSAALNVAFPWLWKSAVDDLATGAVSPTSLAGWLLATGVGHAGVYLGLQGARSYMNREITRIARVFAIDRLADADPELIASWRTGDWVARLHDDADEKSSWFLCSGIFRAWEAALVGGGALVGVVVTAPALAPWALAPLPVLAIAVAVAQRWAAARNREVQAAVSATADQLATTFSAIRTVQAARLAGVARERFAAATEAQQRAEVGAAVLQNATGYLFQSGWQFAVAGLIGFGGGAVLRGEVTLGEFVTLEGLLSTLVWPMFDFGVLVSRLPATAVSLRRLDEVIDVPRAPTPTGQVPVGGELRADGLHVGPWLRDVTLSAGPGERVAVVGRVGCGKSVLLEALAGLRAPTGGAVTFGGVPLAHLPPGAPTAWVPQGPTLLSGTIRENIALGRDLPSAVFDRAVRVSQLARDLDQLSRGLDTVVGEGGALLSGGQRQRVAIARALAGSASVLVLDDATSALDAEVEAAFWDALDRERPDLSVVLVTHRPGTLARVDRVVLLDQGRVVAVGTHAALAAAGGPYGRAYG